MTESTVVAGLVIPSTSPLFVAIVALHVALSLACVATGMVAIVSPKRAGRHPRFGSTYYWLLVAIVITASTLSFMRWDEDRGLFALGLVSLIGATIGRSARRGRWRGWIPLHIAGMGSSYVAMLIAFYVDNGKNLPLWRNLPSASYWLVPLAIGAPLIAYAIVRHARDEIAP